MKQFALEEADLESCVTQAREERVLIVREGKPLALIVGVEGLDREQLELGGSHKFWKLIHKPPQAKRNQPRQAGEEAQRRRVDCEPRTAPPRC